MSVLSADCYPITLLALVILSTLGAPLSKLQYNGRDLVQYLPVDGCATLRVRIWNVGPGAFEPNTYGEHITLERELSFWGTPNADNKVHMYNQRYRHVSARTQDLDRIVSHFNIHLDNPMILVDQALAGTVFQGEPEALYGLVLRSTQLNGWRTACRKAAESTKQLHASKRRLEEALDAKKQEASGLHRQWEQMKQAYESKLQEFNRNLVVRKQLQEDITRKQKLLEHQLIRQSAPEEASDLENAKEECRKVSPIDATDAEVKHIMEKLKISMMIASISKRNHQQVEKDRHIIAKEVTRLVGAVKEKAKQQRRGGSRECVPGISCRGELSAGVKLVNKNLRWKSAQAQGSLMPASRAQDDGGVLVSHTTTATTSKRDKKASNMRTTATHLALHFASAVLVTDLQRARAQLSQLLQRGEELLSRVEGEEATCLSLEEQLKQHLEDSQRNAQVDCAETQGEIARLEESITSLQAVYRESISLVRACANEDHAILRREYEDRPWLPPMHGSKAPDKDPADASNRDLDEGEGRSGMDIEQPVMPTECEELGVAYKLEKRQIEETVKQIGKLQSEESSCFEEFRHSKSQLARKCEALDCSFRRFLSMFNVQGGYLEFDHLGEKLFVRGVPETKAKYRVLSFLLILMEASKLPFCIWRDCEHIVDEEDRLQFLNALIRGGSSLSDQQCLVLTSQSVQSSHPFV